MTAADIAPGEHKFFHRAERMHLEKVLLNLQLDCAAILDVALPLRQLEELGASQFHFLEGSRAENSHTGICPELPNAHPKLLQHCKREVKSNELDQIKEGLALEVIGATLKIFYRQNEKNKNLSMALGSYLRSALCTICRAEISMG